MAHDESDRMAVLEARLEAMAARVASLEHENGRLRTDRASRDGSHGDAPQASVAEMSGHTGPSHGLSRRGLLLGAGAAAAGAVGAAAVSSTPAAADPLTPMYVNVTNGATAVTALSTDFASSALLVDNISGTGIWSRYGGASNIGATAGVVGDTNKTDGIGVAGLAPGSVGLAGVRGQLGFSNLTNAVRAGVVGVSYTDRAVAGVSEFGCGVYGSPDDLAERRNDHVGILGEATFSTGVLGTATSGTGVAAESVNGPALAASSQLGPAAVFSSNLTHVNLAISHGFRDEPTLDDFEHGKGDIVVDSNGSLWCCTATGTPGTWRKLAGQTSAGSFHVLPVPKRIYDSRPITNPPQGPKTKFASNEIRVLDTKHNSTGVPAGATAVLVTLLLVNAYNGTGNFTVWANGQSKPQSNSLVWGAGSGRYTTTAVTAIDADAKIQVSASAPTDLVVDVVGYYR